MKVKQQKVVPSIIPHLSDWELISAYSFCCKILNPQTLAHVEEFEAICFFFFDGNDQLTMEVLEEIANMYKHEYSKRHAN